jgi:hypothetical protein
MKKLILLLAVLLQGCAIVSEYPVTSASTALFVATGKGPADHALSSVAERDCSALRIINNEKICQDYTVAEVVDRTQSLPQPRTDIVAVANDVFAKRAKK